MTRIRSKERRGSHIYPEATGFLLGGAWSFRGSAVLARSNKDIGSNTDVSRGVGNSEQYRLQKKQEHFSLGMKGDTSQNHSTIASLVLSSILTHIQQLLLVIMVIIGSRLFSKFLSTWSLNILLTSTFWKQFNISFQVLLWHSFTYLLWSSSGLFYGPIILLCQEPSHL